MMSPARAIERHVTIGLDEVVSLAALQDRVDVKYLVPVADFARLAERLRETHAVLESDGRRAFGYRTTYFDTPELHAYRAHLQRRRRRYKCRSREYVDSGLVAFEVKLKGARGRTVKHRMAYDAACRDDVTDPALAFLTDCLEHSYGRSPDGALRPSLAVAYTRITLVDLDRCERLTCDFDLRFSAPDGASGRLAEGMVILESKSIGGGAQADRVLRALGARPVSVCSKYCLGVGFTRPEVKSNRLRPLLRRHFLPAPPAAVTLTTTWEDVA
jgi:hypothetical protein